MAELKHLLWLFGSMVGVGSWGRGGGQQAKKGPDRRRPVGLKAGQGSPAHTPPTTPLPGFECESPAYTLPWSFWVEALEGRFLAFESQDFHACPHPTALPEAS